MTQTLTFSQLAVERLSYALLSLNDSSKSTLATTLSPMLISISTSETEKSRMHQISYPLFADNFVGGLIPCRTKWYLSMRYAIKECKNRSLRV